MKNKCKWIISFQKGKLKLLLLLYLTVILSFIAPLRTLAGDNLSGVVG
jgi:hypothetical protein